MTQRSADTQQPYLFAFTPQTLLATPPTLRGPRPRTFSLYADIQRWWLQK